jgi:hypothetical protein
MIQHKVSRAGMKIQSSHQEPNLFTPTLMFARIAFWTPFAHYCCPGLSQAKPFVAKIQTPNLKSS